jgi:hypothetical protein
MSTVSLVLLAFAGGTHQTHELANAVYRELREAGLPVTAIGKARLPTPTMPDSLDAKAQKDVLTKLVGEEYSLDDLLRPSPVAPYILKFRDVQPSDPEAPARGLDVWFVVYGDLQTLINRQFLEQVGKPQTSLGKVDVLDSAALRKRGVLPTADAQRQQYLHVVFPILDRVQLAVTGNVCWSLTADSLLLAGRIDPRFDSDKEFPNHWRPMDRDDEGKPALGPARPYPAGGHYLKITRLAEPERALFVEYHLVFIEPKGWFNGANLLRSKVPFVAQAGVRWFRRELAKAK